MQKPTPATKAFADSNVVLYLLSADTHKAAQAESILAPGVTLSVQVLNEVTNVARRKVGLSWRKIDVMVASLCGLCDILPLTLSTHAHGRVLAERYGLNVYDAMIVSAALLGGCETLYSEDLHDGLLVEGRLRICNPIAAFR